MLTAGKLHTAERHALLVVEKALTKLEHNTPPYALKSGVLSLHQGLSRISYTLHKVGGSPSAPLSVFSYLYPTFQASGHPQQSIVLRPMPL